MNHWDDNEIAVPVSGPLTREVAVAIATASRETSHLTEVIEFSDRFVLSAFLHVEGKKHPVQVYSEISREIAEHLVKAQGFDLEVDGRLNYSSLYPVIEVHSVPYLDGNGHQYGAEYVLVSDEYESFWSSEKTSKVAPKLSSDKLLELLGIPVFDSQGIRMQLGKYTVTFALKPPSGGRSKGKIGFIGTRWVRLPQTTE